MNVNLLQQTPTIKDWLIDASLRLKKVDVISARLDAELIMAESINKSRTYLHAHDDEIINKKHKKIADSYIARRINHEPIAYIVGYRDFYGRKFIVTPNTLIPRPESEDIITVLSHIIPSTTYHLHPAKLVDVGTGSGCLGITAKLEFPFLEVTLLDISRKALSVAKQNAQKFKTNVKIVDGNLLKNYHDNPNIIIANLPYVDASWQLSSETDFEPRIALFADKNGLASNEQLIIQASEI